MEGSSKGDGKLVTLVMLVLLVLLVLLALYNI